MRLWTIHPSQLDTKGLVALWREGLGAQASLIKQKGYYNHPQLDRFKQFGENAVHVLARYLHEVANEADSRGYKFNRSKIIGDPNLGSQTINENKGQLGYEWDWYMSKIQTRDPKRHQEYTEQKTSPLAHPSFTMGEGDIQPWEKVKKLSVFDVIGIYAEDISIDTMKGKGMTTQEIIKIYSTDYRGEHTAPGPEYGASMDNCSPNIYPEDIYGPNAVRYYGDGSNLDAQSIQIIQGARGKPNKPVKIYRAIPKFITNQEKIDKYTKEKKYILQHGKMPPTADNRSMDRSEYFDFIDEELARLQKEPAQESGKITINPGDWVTINRGYALSHGDSHLSTSRILSKTVPAGTLFTDGNSVHEWGYHP